MNHWKIHTRLILKSLKRVFFQLLGHAKMITAKKIREMLVGNFYPGLNRGTKVDC